MITSEQPSLACDVTKFPVTQQQRDNALFARDVMWPSVPPENVYPNLEGFRDEVWVALVPATCNTIACFGGWVAVNPHFQSQGVRPDSYGAPKMGPSTRQSDSLSTSLVLFGDYYGLFRSRGCHIADVGFTGTDHELVTHRLNWLIENSEVVE